ncbi:hypothetical protein SAMN05192574_113136 [Mucilaginibacter gossypiicola]|uniref:Uncharacterized protein n=1 Tax=Mucilaginibacter gossypiicola TaxID=551995 RepID=A0A1H8SSH9_9SPHI|nr:hypothetical protein [Mucilaginibacter gossypiicola]SEO81601.1 hypothetical protein SAMN05192574_113136 [Mucilaginibacter gossypiicola]
MSTIHDAAWNNLISTINLSLPLRDSWDKIIISCSELIKVDYWDKLKQIDIEANQVGLALWMERLVTQSPLPENVSAIWIGIIKILNEDDNGTEKEAYAIYLTGSENYAPDDAEWAVEPVYDPQHKYVIPDILNLVDDLLKSDQENYAFTDWILPLAYTSLAISDIINFRLKKENFLKYRQSLFVSVGFDDGDLVNVTPIT